MKAIRCLWARARPCALSRIKTGRARERDGSPLATTCGQEITVLSFWAVTLNKF